MAEKARKQYVTVTRKGLTLQAWKETTLIIGTITMLQVYFIVAHVHSPLIRLPDLNDSRTIIHTGDKPYIEFGQNEQLQLLHLIGAHPHIASMVLPGFHTPNEIKFDNTVQTRSGLSQQANIPRELRLPAQPTKQEQDEHRITHLPDRSWCPICVKAKGQPTHHRKGALKEQSILQLDYTYIKSMTYTYKKWQVQTILTGIETTTGLCLAIPTTRKGQPSSD
eukprot:816197-Amphidinium_carterae.2